MQIKASIKNFRSAPRKARDIADFVRGKDLNKALMELKFISKRSASGIRELLLSAKANAENNFSLDSSKLFIDFISVEDGQVLKRHRIGKIRQVLPIKKKLSNVYLTLSEKQN